MKDTGLRERPTESGNTFFTSLVFVFVLVGTLRICCNKTLHESKLTGIFIQETQGYYLLENLMALARDYAYQLTQNPREPNLFLTASSYRKKDKTYQNSQGEENAWVIDFNGSLSKQQIVPDDFPLQIAENGWDIKGGPIFWQDKKKDSNDERWLSEVVMVGSLNITNSFIPDWNIHMAQTMEIERNPLCDFQLYAEGELSSTTWPYSYLDRMFCGPIQINGNVRFHKWRGKMWNPTGVSSAVSVDFFYNKFNIAGHALNGQAGYESIKLPQKYHIQDNSDVYASLANPYYTEGYHFHCIRKDAINYGSTNIIDYSGNDAYLFKAASNYYCFSNAWSDSTKQSYEHKSLEFFNGNLTTRSRICRPCGFDPIGYGGYWSSTSNFRVGKNINGNMTDTSTADSLILDTGFGLYVVGTCLNSLRTCLFRSSQTYSVFEAMSHLRGLNAYQMVEKAYLVNFQATAPSLVFYLSFVGANGSPTSALHWPFTTYLNDSFHPKNDNSFLQQFLGVRQQLKNGFSLSSVFKGIFNSNQKTSLTTKNTKPSSDPNIDSASWNERMQKNRLVANELSFTKLSNSIFSNILIEKSSFLPTGYSDKTCPPHKIIDFGTYWGMDNYVTRIRSDDAYQYMYDRNRAKWIRIIDFDVGALKAAIGDTISQSDWDAMQHTVLFLYSGVYIAAGDMRRYERNYTYNGHDIRYNYANDRMNFFNEYSDGSYLGTTNIYDVGIRIINAKSLPAGGLTIISPFPLYIKGNFNSITKEPKACIMADSITVLSDAWQDWKSQMDPYYSHIASWVQDSENNTKPTGVTIYAHIMTGRTYPDYWIKNDPNVCPDLGLHDAIRTLEYFNTDKIYVYGSILLPYYAHEQWEPPINFTSHDLVPNGTYGCPALTTGMSDCWTPMRTAPGIPFFHRINRGRKTQAIGETIYNTIIGNTLYDKDWDDTSYTFSTYHSALPNFLKYEVNP